jgi:MFS family permease
MVFVLEVYFPAPGSPADTSYPVFREIWRFEVFLSAVPALLLLALVLFVLPQSPVWLMRRGARIADDQERGKLLSRKPDNGNLDRVGPPSAAELRALSSATKAAFVLVIPYQFTLISVLLYYTAELLTRMGCPEADSRKWALVVGIGHTVFAALPMPLLDRVGRRSIQFGGLVLVVLSAFALAGVQLAEDAAGVNSDTALALEEHTQWFRTKFVILMIFLLGFQAGPAAAYFVLISEMFPVRFRERGNALGSALLFACDVIVASLYPITEDVISVAGLFAVAGAIGLVSGCLLFFMLPETAGVPLDAVTDMWEEWSKTTKHRPDLGNDRKDPKKI